MSNIKKLMMTAASGASGLNIEEVKAVSCGNVNPFCRIPSIECWFIELVSPPITSEPFAKKDK